MDAIRLDEHGFDLSGALERVEAGATVEITREGRPIATLTHIRTADNRSAPHPSWKEAGVDWDEIRRFRESLPYDPTNSVLAMREEEPY